jgi:hypothetical protein
MPDLSVSFDAIIQEGESMCPLALSLFPSPAADGRQAGESAEPRS